jgi:hypothetical protein
MVRRLAAALLLALLTLVGIVVAVRVTFVYADWLIERNWNGLVTAAAFAFPFVAALTVVYAFPDSYRRP